MGIQTAGESDMQILIHWVWDGTQDSALLPQFFIPTFIHVLYHITFKFFPLRGKVMLILIIHESCTLSFPTC